eukprot:GHVU01097747.1.p1 GENE.GHVU01097747.1~~GHVU01097747.1.p1  ORF type:complete len:182 (-),score=8.58 GHVU01097747.1:1089-1634(-)
MRFQRWVYGDHSTHNVGRIGRGPNYLSMQSHICACIPGSPFPPLPYTPPAIRLFLSRFHVPVRASSLTVHLGPSLLFSFLFSKGKATAVVDSSTTGPTSPTTAATAKEGSGGEGMEEYGVVCVTGARLHGARWDSKTNTIAEPHLMEQDCELPLLRLTVHHRNTTSPACQLAAHHRCYQAL